MTDRDGQRDTRVTPRLVIGLRRDFTQDRCPARLGLGVRWVALSIGCPLEGVALIWTAIPRALPVMVWLKRGLPSSS